MAKINPTVKVFSLLVLFALPAICQELPDKPAPKPQARIFDRETLGELAVVAASLSADAMSTEKRMEFGAREPNPIVRPFVQNRIGTGLYFGGVFAADVYGTYLLRKHHHPRVARAWNIGLIMMEGTLAGINYAKINNSNFECVLHNPVVIAGQISPCLRH